MLADHHNVVAEAGEHLRAQVAQPSVTKHDDALVPPDFELRGDLKRGGDRFGEDSRLVVHRIRYGVQVAFGHRDEIRKCTIAADDTGDGTIRAVTGMTVTDARVAAPAAAVDFPHHATAGEGSADRDADVLVPEDPAEAVIPLYDLQVGLADAGAHDTDEHLTWPWPRIRSIGFDCDGRSIKDEGTHASPTEYRAMAARRRSRRHFALVEDLALHRDRAWSDCAWALRARLTGVVNRIDGIQILSTAINVPGPVAAKALRDMGAAVLKVEPPGGDPLAAAAPSWYRELHTGIEVQSVDLKSEDGRARLHGWLERADVLITATRPAALERLGLSWGTLRHRYARLCHVAVVGYPRPRQDEAGHDLTYQADAGLLTPPVMPRTLIADLAGAHRVVSAALALLLARERGARPGYEEVALSEAAAVFAAPLRHGLTDESGWLGGGVAPYGLYETQHGWVAIAALEPHFHAALARELAVDIDDRAALSRVLAQRSANQWHRWALERGLPLTAVAQKD